MLRYWNVCKNYSKQWTFLNIFNKYNPPRKFVCQRYFSERAIDVNTNVVKDVILYKFDNSRYFKLMNLFAFAQFGFWSYLSLTAYTTLRDAPVDQTTGDHWWEKINLGENKYRNGISLFCGIVGWGILSIVWMYSLRSVRYLILRRGGNQLTVVTYTPVASNRMFTLNLNNVSAVDSRLTAQTHLALKIKGHFMYYIVDMKGEFVNPILFDHTVGLRRTLK
ncbi:transmembrane protein 223 [Diorhabda sublineata]|nr:transmembrane protein 223 [Diorhabda sublineata]